MVGQTTYPIGTVEGLSVVVPVAGDPDSALLRLTHDGLAQDLALSDLTRTDDAAAAGLYSELTTEPKESDTRRGELSISATEKEDAFSGSTTYNVSAERLAYDSERKWPEAGKSWLKVILGTSNRGPEWKGDGFLRGHYDLNRAVQVPTLQVDGETIAGEVGDQDESFFGGGREIWFQVPADSPKATFSADLKVDGTLKTATSNADNAPASVEHIYQVRDVNLEFGPRTDKSSN